MKTNYHTHTYRCKHAMGNDERIVERAINAGIDILGFSDHNPWPRLPAGYDSHASRGARSIYRNTAKASIVCAKNIKAK